MHYHFKIHKEQGEYWAECLELKGCVTQGATKEALIKNMAEALNVYLDEPQDSDVMFPLPFKRSRASNVVRVPVEPNIAFAFMLRRERLQKKMTQKQAAHLLGMKNIYSYQRLEQSRTANPALSMLTRIKHAFPSLNVEEILTG